MSSFSVFIPYSTPVNQPSDVPWEIPETPFSVQFGKPEQALLYGLLFPSIHLYVEYVEVVNTGWTKNSVRAHFLVPSDFGTCTLFPSSLLNQTGCQARNAPPPYGAQEKKQKRHSPSAWLTHILLLHPPNFAN